MRIDTENKIVYFANPKTGSTSLRKMMDKYCDFSIIKHLNNNNMYHDHWSINNYNIIFNILNKQTKSNIYLSEYFSFTTIRNPWDRVVSAFKYQKCDKNGYPFYHTDYDKNTAKQYSFSEFLKNIHDKDYWCGIGIPNANYFFFDENNNQLVTKIYPIEILTKEIIESDIKKYFEIDYDIKEIPHLNATKIVDYRRYYTEKWMIDKVREVYKKDIEIGNYSF